MPDTKAPLVATIRAPAAAPTVPKTVAPPLVPRGTAGPNQSRRGSTPLHIPVDVAQVSAAAAARVPVTSQRPS